VFTACSCVVKVITFIGSNQGNYIENATGCCKRTLKTAVATQLKWRYYLLLLLSLLGQTIELPVAKSFA